MDANQNPTRPVIPSHLSAETSAQNWLQRNSNDRVIDASGLEWKISLQLLETPNVLDHRRAIIELTMKIETSASAAVLLKTGTLKLPEDQRLIDLIGESNIPFSRKPIYCEAESYDAARNFVAEQLQRTKQQLQSDGLHEIKRTLIGRWIDQKMSFGGGDFL